MVAGILAAALIVPAQVFAWGNAGHEAVAFVAWQQMTPATRARAIALIKQIPTQHNSDNTKSIPGYTEFVADLPAGLSQDQQNQYLFMRVATWPDSIKHQWLHDSDNPPAGEDSALNKGFSDGDSHGYWHFVDAGFATDKSAVPATPVPNAATKIAAFRTAIASAEADALKAYDLAWLEHMVGDVHQPLHGAMRIIGGQSDAGGNSVAVKLPVAMEKVFEGTVSKSAPKELHAFWDDLPGEGDPKSALTIAAKFGGSLKAASAEDLKVTDPLAWAAESLAIAKSDVYKTPIGAGLKPATGSGWLITQAYYNKALADAQTRVALAGARLAKLLNENLK